MNENIKKMLEKQLELLSERSHDLNQDIAKITDAMVSLVVLLSNYSG